jgi:hypothetical protein
LDCFDFELDEKMRRRRVIEIPEGEFLDAVGGRRTGGAMEAG